MDLLEGWKAWRFLQAVETSCEATSREEQRARFVFDVCCNIDEQHKAGREVTSNDLRCLLAFTIKQARHDVSRSRFTFSDWLELIIDVGCRTGRFPSVFSEIGTVTLAETFVEEHDSFEIQRLWNSERPHPTPKERRQTAMHRPPSVLDALVGHVRAQKELSIELQTLRSLGQLVEKPWWTEPTKSIASAMAPGQLALVKCFVPDSERESPHWLDAQRDLIVQLVHEGARARTAQMVSR
jgi:hypothetical protein